MIKSVQSLNPCQSVIQTIYDIITKGHGGELFVETGEGIGTNFMILIPIK